MLTPILSGSSKAGGVLHDGPGAEKLSVENSAFQAVPGEGRYPSGFMIEAGCRFAALESSLERASRGAPLGNGGTA